MTEEQILARIKECELEAQEDVYVVSQAEWNRLKKLDYNVNQRIFGLRKMIELKASECGGLIGGLYAESLEHELKILESLYKD